MPRRKRPHSDIPRPRHHTQDTSALVHQDCPGLNLKCCWSRSLSCRSLYWLEKCSHSLHCPPDRNALNRSRPGWGIQQRNSRGRRTHPESAGSSGWAPKGCWAHILSWHLGPCWTTRYLNGRLYQCPRRPEKKKESNNEEGYLLYGRLHQCSQHPARKTHKGGLLYGKLNHGP